MNQQNTVIDFAMPSMDTLAQFRRRSHADNVQDIWRKYGWGAANRKSQGFQSNAQDHSRSSSVALLIVNVSSRVFSQ